MVTLTIVYNVYCHKPVIPHSDVSTLRLSADLLITIIKCCDMTLLVHV